MRGAFRKELISGLSPLLSDWSTSITFLLITLSLVVSDKRQNKAVFSPVMFAVGKQLAKLVPCSSTDLKSGHLPKRNGERRMAS